MATRLLLVTVASILLMFISTPGSVRASSSGTISGHVCQYGSSPCAGIYNIHVNFAYAADFAPNNGVYDTYTASDGSFTYAGTVSNSAYYAGVNGKVYYMALSSGPDNAAWDQRVDVIQTDANGNGNHDIYLSPVTKVNVVAGALFSNTPYATLFYEYTQMAYVGHALSFSAAGSGFSSGYQSTESLTASFTQEAGSSGYMWMQQYAYAFACADYNQGFCSYYPGGQGVHIVGLSPTVPLSGWTTTSTSEFLGTSSLPTNKLASFSVAVHSPKRWDAYEAFSTTYSTTYGAAFSIGYNAFGINIQLQDTISSANTNLKTIGYSINVDPIGQSRTFLVYPDYNDQALTGGTELHVWDISQPCSASASPTTGKYSVTPQFSVTCAAPLSYTYVWYFGDGTTTTTQNPTHTYSLIPGDTSDTYYPTLTVTDQLNNKYYPSVPQITVTCGSPCIQSPVQNP